MRNKSEFLIFKCSKHQRHRSGINFIVKSLTLSRLDICIFVIRYCFEFRNSIFGFKFCKDLSAIKKFFCQFCLSAPACRVCDADRCNAQADTNFTIKRLTARLSDSTVRLSLAFGELSRTVEGRLKPPLLIR